MTFIKCPICSLDSEILSQVEQDYLDGSSITEIGIKYNLNVDQLSNHFENCIVPPKSTSELFKGIIKDVEDMIILSRDAIKGKPNSPGLQQSYVRLIETYKDLIKDAESLRAPEETVKDIISRVINPFLRDILQDITGEIDTLKGILSRHGIPQDKVDNIATECFVRIGKRIQDAVIPALRNLNSYFGVKVDEEDITKSDDHVIN